MATQEDVITTSIDLRRMVNEAMAAGFNPLTVLRSGAAAGFGTQRIQTGVVGGGSFTEQPTHSEPLPPVAPPLADGGGRLASGELYGPAEGSAWDPNVVRGMSRGEAREIFGGSSEPASYSPWEAESEFNMAVHQLRMRNAGTGNVVTDDGVVIRTNHAAQYSQGGMFNPITYTGPVGQGYTPAGGGVKLPKDKLSPVTQVIAGGHAMPLDQGWSDAEIAERRWGEGEFLSPTWFYQWGVAGADFLKGQADNADRIRKEKGLPAWDRGGNGWQTITDAFGRQFSRRDGVYDGKPTTWMTGGGF